MLPGRSALSVDRAILPVALQGASADGDLARACLLIETLGQCWQDPTPFQVLVVSPDQDFPTVSGCLQGSARVHVAHHNEGAFLPRDSDFYKLPGWWKQQILKLYIPAVMEFGPYLTFDSDIVCCRSFTGATFVQDGRLISQWEPKGCQEWWRNIAELRGCPYDELSYGLSVTPNVLHSELSRQALISLGDDIPGMLRRLLEWYLLLRKGSAWTEYSLYTTSAETAGNLFDYHVQPHAAMRSGVSIHSHANVWDADGCGRLGALTQATLGGHFLVVQSTAGMSIGDVRSVALRLVAEAEPGQCTEIGAP